MKIISYQFIKNFFQFCQCMIAIENTKECYVQLWLRLEHTRQLLEQQGRRFCVRSLIRSWWPELTVNGELYIIGGKPFDDFVWEVCHMAEIEGYQHLQPPSLYLIIAV